MTRCQSLRVRLVESHDDHPLSKFKRRGILDIPAVEAKARSSTQWRAVYKMNHSYDRTLLAIYPKMPKAPQHPHNVPATAPYWLPAVNNGSINPRLVRISSTYITGVPWVYRSLTCPP